jgi:hypothetical protein
VGRPSKRTREELIELLAEQRSALAASCQNYDGGNEWEAARLATTIFTLLHDGGPQLGVRGSLRFASTAWPPVDPENLITETPLVMMRLTDGGAKYLPKCGEGPFAPRRLQFPHWSADELIYRDGSFQLSRRRLVFALRHQEGGSHIGELTDEAYIRFKTKAIWSFGRGVGPPEPVYGAVAATMRQLAWEVMETLTQLGEVT